MHRPTIFFSVLTLDVKISAEQSNMFTVSPLLTVCIYSYFMVFLRVLENGKEWKLTACECE